MNNPTINLQGGIVSGYPVLLTAVDPATNNLYVMTLQNGTVTMVQALDSNCNLIVPSGNTILSFTVTEMGESLVFRSSNGQLTYSSAGTLTLTSAGDARDIFFVQGEFQGLERPFILMSGVMYIPYGDENTTMRLSVNVSGMTTPQQWQLIPVPLNYYQSCSSPDGNTTLSDVRQALRLTQCSYNSSLGCCAGLMPAWTTQIDCFNGNSFAYCQAGTFCTGNCVSECQVPTDLCIYQGNSMYSCQSAIVPPAPIVPPPATPVSSSTWFWLLLAFIIILIIGAFIVAYYQSAPTEVYSNSYSSSVHSHPNPGWIMY